MRTIALSFLLLAVVSGAGVQHARSQDSIVHIPDTAFLYAPIVEGGDTDGGSWISFREAEAEDSIDVSYRKISDITGIEAFLI